MPYCLIGDDVGYFWSSIFGDIDETNAVGECFSITTVGCGIEVITSFGDRDGRVSQNCHGYDNR